MKTIQLAILILLVAVWTGAQQAPDAAQAPAQATAPTQPPATPAATLQAPDKPGQWVSRQATDPLRGTSWTEFSLFGIFLRAPVHTDLPFPMLVVKCNPGRHRYGTGYLNGKIIQGFIIVGGVVDSHFYGGNSPSVHVQYRRDDGKLQDNFWSHSTDFSAVYFDSPDLRLGEILYSHGLPHKENTNPQVRKFVVGLPEYIGTEVVMQFDFPDSTDVADTCGVIWHR
jgi:hypothetical protein